VRSKPKSLATARSQVFLSAWVLYAGYYICRKDINPTTGPGASHLAISLVCFGAAYALGQLVGGMLADGWGARRTALTGAGISILCTSLQAFHSLPVFSLLLLLGNGLGQGLGWPSMLRLIGMWFQRGERDRVLGWWSISYILGGVLATSLTAWLLVHTRVALLSGFQPAYLVSSSVLLLAALFFYLATDHLPYPALAHALPATSALSASDAPRTQIGLWSEILANRRIQVISVVYFFLKMTRYTLLFWLPLYLTSSLGYSQHSAEQFASYFELLGFLGPLAAAYAIERWFGERHMVLGAGMLFALAFTCLLHPVLASSGWFGTAVSISLTGILIYGADVLMSAMAVLDSVPDQLHGRAAGFVNGIGSIGQTLSPFLVTIFVLHFGWTKLFDLFVFFALVAGAVCACGAHLQSDQSSATNRSVAESTHIPT
jgi:sugar phosphate permease